VTDDPFAATDAAYVLGALSPQERQEFERHLLECDACRESVRRLAGLPGLLAGTDPAMLVAETGAEGVVEAGGRDDGVPPTLLPALIARVRRQRRRRQWTLGSAIAAAAAAVAVLVGSVVTSPGVAPTVAGRTPTPTATATAPGGSSGSGMLAMRQVIPGPMHASVQLTDVAWGTRIDVHCHYKEMPGAAWGGSPYELVLTDRQGKRERAAGWQGIPGTTASVQAATAWRPDQIAKLEIDLPGGKPVLRLTR
jgi:anti-sigma factor RsiW